MRTRLGIGAAIGSGFIGALVAYAGLADPSRTRYRRARVS